MSPVSGSWLTELPATRFQRSRVSCMDVINVYVELSACFATDLIGRSDRLFSEKTSSAILRHQTQNHTRAECKFGHPWNVESRGDSKSPRIENGTPLLVPDV